MPKEPDSPPKDSPIKTNLIGYIETINTDSNNMTRSGTIIPVVDFKHLDEVLVITEIKENPY